MLNITLLGKILNPHFFIYPININGDWLYFSLISENTIGLFNHQDICIQQYAGHTRVLTCVATYSSGGQTYLVSGSDDKTRRCWDARTGLLLKTLHLEDVVISLTMLGGDNFIAGIRQGTFLHFNLRKILNPPFPSLQSLALSVINSHSQILASASSPQLSLPELLKNQLSTPYKKIFPITMS
jgi:WD40 repeat protein